MHVPSEIILIIYHKTQSTFEGEYRGRLQEEYYQEQNLREIFLAGTEFDAAWAMAEGLHIASEKVSMNDSSGCDGLLGELVPLENFDYKNDKMGCVLRKSFHQVNFHGITVSCKKKTHNVVLS